MWRSRARLSLTIRSKPFEYGIAPSALRRNTVGAGVPHRKRTWSLKQPRQEGDCPTLISRGGTGLLSLPSHNHITYLLSQPGRNHEAFCTSRRLYVARTAGCDWHHRRTGGTAVTRRQSCPRDGEA